MGNGNGSGDKKHLEKIAERDMAQVYDLRIKENLETVYYSLQLFRAH